MIKDKKIIFLRDQLPESELIIPASAKVDYIFLFTDKLKNDLDLAPVITVGDQAEVNIYYCYLGEYNVKVNLQYHLGSQAKVNHYLMFIGSAEQNLFFQEKYIFQGQRTLGRFIARGLVQDKARATCDGNIMIRPGSQQTDAYLDMQGVIMDRSARVDMIPGLQIEANDVKASHAAKVSMLDDEQLFYLRSRGLTVEQAKNFFINGMFGQLVENITEENIRTEILGVIRQKLYGRN